MTTTTPTIRELYEQGTELADGWTIDAHEHGLTLCSPGTSAADLGHRDESDQPIGDLLPPAYQWDAEQGIIDAA